MPDPAAPLEADDAAWLGQHLKQRIADPAGELALVRGKKLKESYKRLLRSMQADDELWEWEWFGMIGRRNAYSIGWCVVREGAVVQSFCHSSS